MTNKAKPSFLRLYVTGFAIGAAVLVGAQVADGGLQPIIAPSHAMAR